MNMEATKEDVERAVGITIRSNHLQAHIVEGESKTVIGVIGDKQAVANLSIEAFKGVEKLCRFHQVINWLVKSCIQNRPLSMLVA